MRVDGDPSIPVPPDVFLHPRIVCHVDPSVGVHAKYVMRVVFTSVLEEVGDAGRRKGRLLVEFPGNRRNWKLTGINSSAGEGEAIPAAVSNEQHVVVANEYGRGALTLLRDAIYSLS